MFGFDDDESIFRETVDFRETSGVHNATFSPRSGPSPFVGLKTILGGAMPRKRHKPEGIIAASRPAAQAPRQAFSYRSRTRRTAAIARSFGRAGNVPSATAG